MRGRNPLSHFALKPKEQTVWEPTKPGTADILEDQREYQWVLAEPTDRGVNFCNETGSQEREYVAYQSNASIISARAAGPKTTGALSYVAAEAQP